MEKAPFGGISNPHLYHCSFDTFLYSNFKTIVTMLNNLSISCFYLNEFGGWWFWLTITLKSIQYSIIIFHPTFIFLWKYFLLPMPMENLESRLTQQPTITCTLCPNLSVSFFLSLCVLSCLSSWLIGSVRCLVCCRHIYIYIWALVPQLHIGDVFL